MEFKKITRLSIFIDYDNFSISYCNKHDIEEEDISIWDGLSKGLLNYYENNFKNDFEVIEHTGTFLCVGMSDNLFYDEDKDLKERFQVLDRKTGFIVRYGYRDRSKKKKGKFILGKEKGVDAEIICQMMMGAFLNHYDACILMSDDKDYIPAVRRIQDYFGKKVIQAGFINGKLRNQAFSHIPLENTDEKLQFLNEAKKQLIPDIEKPAGIV